MLTGEAKAGGSCGKRQKTANGKTISSNFLEYLSRRALWCARSGIRPVLYRSASVGTELNGSTRCYFQLWRWCWTKGSCWEVEKLNLGHQSVSFVSAVLHQYTFLMSPVWLFREWTAISSAILRFLGLMLSSKKKKVKYRKNQITTAWQRWLFNSI